MFNGMFFWGSFCVLLSIIFVDATNDSVIVLFILGTPIVGIFIFFAENPHKKYLDLTLEQAENGELWLLKIKYLLSLILQKDSDKTSILIINGFVNCHEINCNIPDCPLKSYVLNYMELSKDKKKKSNLIKVNEDNSKLLNAFLGRLYIMGLAKFPKCTSLRISYVFYLIEKANNKNLALSELLTTEIYDPGFDEQFIIFRFKKMLSEEGSQEKSDDNEISTNLDVVAVIAYENHYKMCKECIENAASCHLDFWTSLMERYPDLFKLNKAGTKINQLLIEIDDHWNKMQKINPNTPKAIKMYSDFMIMVLNEEERGKDLLERNKAALKTGKQNKSFESGPMAFAPEGNACIIASADKDNLGIINTLNSSACRTFGFYDYELKGKNINILMPEIYAKYHSKFLEGALNNPDEAKQKEDKFVLGRHKSNYLIPLILNAKIFTSINQGLQFVAVFKYEKKTVNVCYILLDKTKTIVGLSSRCISYLNLTNKTINNTQIKIGVLAPGLYEGDQIQECMKKAGAPLSVFKAEILTEGSKKKSQENSINISYISHISAALNSGQSNISIMSREQKNLNYSIKVIPSQKEYQFICHFSNIALSEIGIEGYILRLEPMAEQSQNVLQKKPVKEFKKSTFQFLFDPAESKYVRSYDNDPIGGNTSPSFVGSKGRMKSVSNLTNCSRNISQAKIGQNNPESHHTEEKKATDENEKNSKKIDYGEGITTYRYIGWGEFESLTASPNVLEQKKKEELKEIIEEKVDEKKLQEDKNIELNNLRIKKKNINAEITSRKVPSSIQSIRIFGYISISVIVCLIIIEFILTEVYYNILLTSFKLSDLSFREITIQMRIAYEIDWYVIYNKPSVPKFNENDILPETIAKNKKQIISAFLDEYYSIQNNLTLISVPLSKEHNSLINDISTSLILLTDNNNNKIMNYSLTDSLLMMTSNIFTVKENLENSATLTNSQVYFILYNSFSNLQDNLFKSANLYVLDLEDNINSNNNNTIIFFTISLGLFAIIILILFPMISNISKSKNEVLKLFLDIPFINVKILLKKCDNFLQSSRSRNKDEVASNQEFSLDEKGNEDNTPIVEETKKSKKRNFRNNKSTNTGFFIKFIIGVIIIESYFVVNFAMNRVYLNILHCYNQEHQQLSLLQPELTKSMAIFEELLGHTKIIPKSSNDTFNILAQTEISTLYAIATEILNLHSRNEGSILQLSYINEFSNIMMNSQCSNSNQFGSDFNCNDFAEGIVSEGIHPVIIFFIERLREMLRQYMLIQSNDNIQDKLQSVNDTLLNTIDYKELEIICNQIIETTFTSLRNSMITSLTGKHNSESTRRVIMFIVILVLLFVTFMFLWSPFITTINKEVNLI